MWAFSLYGADLFKAIFQCHFWNNWNLFYLLFFFGKKKEDYLYARYIQRHYTLKNVLSKKVIVAWILSESIPILMHYNFKYRCVGMCLREGREGKSSVHKNWFRLCWLVFVCCCLPPFSNDFPPKVEMFSWEKWHFYIRKILCMCIYIIYILMYTLCMYI